MSTTHPLAPFARAPRPAGIFADVTGVDECGAPILPAGIDLGICENEMPATTRVRVYGPDGHQITTVQLRLAERDVARGILVRTGAHTFALTARSLRLGDGPGLTANQKRRRFVQAERIAAGVG